MATNFESKDDKASCFLCCEQFQNATGNKNGRDSLRLLFRQIGLETDKGGGSPNELETCSDCATLLENYGTIYHQWKYLELQLQWRIHEVGEVMRSADTVPKCVKTVTKRCHEDNRAGTAKLMGCSIRSRLKRECKQYHSKAMPKLILKKIDRNWNRPRVAEASHPGGNRTNILFLGWLGTFVVVVALLDFDHIQSKSPSAIFPFFLFLLGRATSVREEVGQFKLFKFEEISQSADSCECEPDPQKSPTIALGRQVYRPTGCKWNIVENEPPQLVKKTPPVKLKTPTTPIATASKEQIVKNVPPPRSKSNPPASNSGKGIMFKCYKCVLVCSRRDNLKRHLKTVHAGCPVKIISIATAKTSQMPTDKTGISSRATISSKQGTFKCPHCNVMFNWQKNLARHVRDQHPKLSGVNTRPGKIKSGRGPFPCSFCDARYNSRKTLQEHVRDQHDPLDKDKEGGTSGRRVPGKDGRWAFQCSYCDAKCNWRRNLAKHVRNLHPDVVAGSTTKKAPRPFQCSYCDANYMWRHSLIRHVREQHPEVYVDTDPGCRPVKNQNGPGTFPCDYSDAKYSWGKDLGKHIRILHTEVDGETDSHNSTQVISNKQGGISREPTTDTGDDCGALEDLPARNLHLKGTPIVAVRHKTSGKRKRKETRGVYPCQHCGEKFSWRKNLIRHVRKQHPGKDAMDIDPHENFESAYCDATSMPSASGPEPTGSKLGTVDKTDSNKNDPNRVYPCPKCGKRHLKMKSCHNSSQRDVLIKLNATLDFICQFCNEDFRYRDHLMRHVAGKHKFVHENARQYRNSVASAQRGVYFCPFCGLHTEYRSPMIEHLKQNHWQQFGVSKGSRIPEAPAAADAKNCATGEENKLHFTL